MSRSCETDVLKNNVHVFEFGKKQFKQKTGVAMGNNLAATFAIIFMARCKVKAFATAPDKPSFYRRYIDDGIMLWTHRLAKLLNSSNTQHPMISFTMEHSGMNDVCSINYLDLSIDL